MSLTAALVLQLTVTETLESASNPFASATSKDKEVIHNGMNTSATLPIANTVPATAMAFKQQALTAGAATIDLRTLLGTNGQAVDGNGLKVQAIKFRGKSTNTNPITVTEGASNGYELLGNGFTFALKPGQEILIYLKDQSPDIGASAKTIDLSGTGTEVLEYLLVMG